MKTHSGETVPSEVTAVEGEVRFYTVFRKGTSQTNVKKDREMTSGWN